MSAHGSLLVSIEGEARAAALPASLDETKLHEMAGHLARSLAALDRSKRTISELDLTFQDRRLLARTVRPGDLVRLCPCKANSPLINLSLGPIVKKIAAELKPKYAPAEPEAPAPPPAPEPAPPAGLPPTMTAETPAAKEPSGLLKRSITEAPLIVRAAG